MRLVNVQVKNFRTFGGDNSFDLSDGVNCFVGPNNCGKSNLFRAIALAMDPKFPFDRDQDLPTFLLGGRPPVPRITLTFRADPQLAHEATLLNRARNYERSVRGPGVTFADTSEVRLVVTFLGNQRVDSFAVRGVGARTGASDSDEFRRLYAQFRRVVRFVLVRSGESLESLLQGRLREILQLVIQDHLRAEVAAAEAARNTYVNALQDALLLPLRDRIQSVVGDVFPEIGSAELIPGIPSIAQTLSSVEVRLSDAATTDLYGKGTGVRGAVLAAILQYLADQSRRSIMFAVEEPEAFLHPAAQEDLREKLEALAVRPDVTLLVTTHSPFILSHKPEGRVTSLLKKPKGETVITGSVQGDSRDADLVTGLFRDAITESVIDRALSVPTECRGILVVEGPSDVDYLKLAASMADRPELLDGLHLVTAGGAKKAVLQTLLLASATDKPIVTLFDFDDIGRSCRDRLAQFERSKSKEIVSVSDATGLCKNHDLEAEDLWPSDLVGSLLDQIGEDGHLTAKEACGGGWHYRLTYLAKDQLLPWLQKNAEPGHADRWISLLEVINGRVEKLAKASSSSRRAIH